jgi:DNA-binding MarR family transcriptional regulator
MGAHMQHVFNQQSGFKRDILIAADNAMEREGIAELSIAAGLSLKAVLDSESACQWLRDGRPVDTILVILTDPDTTPEHLLAEAGAFSSRNDCGLIIVGPIAVVDQVYAHCGSAVPTFISEHDTSEIAATLALAAQHRELAFADVSGELEPQRLRRLADEVSRIARTLASLSDNQRPSEGYGANLVSDFQRPFRFEESTDMDAAETLPSAEEVRRLLRLRRLRDSFFDASLFADPAWDILLDLTAARIERVQVAVSSLCIAASVPPTTALRWIKAMTDHGLLERVADPDDGRRVFIQLSTSALTGIKRYFSAVRKMGGIAI